MTGETLLAPFKSYHIVSKECGPSRVALTVLTMPSVVSRLEPEQCMTLLIVLMDVAQQLALEHFPSRTTSRDQDINVVHPNLLLNDSHFLVEKELGEVWLGWVFGLYNCDQHTAKLREKWSLYSSTVHEHGVHAH